MTTYQVFNDDDTYMKKLLKIKFVDYWPDLTDDNNFFLQLLSDYYEIEISDKPDIIFYSVFGVEHLRYNCNKIAYIGENIMPNYRRCDYAFSFDNTNSKNFFLPHFVEYKHFFDFVDQVSNKSIDDYRTVQKNHFCAFLASNDRARDRIEFVQKLMQYKKVDCYGPVLYNMEERYYNVRKYDNHKKDYIDWRSEKLDIIKKYKFTISFENQRHNNYITEKIYQPLLVKSIPIYWGAPNVSSFFNSKCYIDVADYDSFDRAIDEIIKIDQDDDLYNQYVRNFPVHQESKIHNITKKNIYLQVKKVIELEHKKTTLVYIARIVCNNIMYVLLILYSNIKVLVKRIIRYIIYNR